MKKIISLFVFCILSTPSIADTADEVLNAVSGKTSKFFSNLIPGEGHTEVGIDIRENFSPSFNILAVRELLELDDGNFFTQFSIFNTDDANDGDERFITNLGFGRRILQKDNTLMLGFNNFYDFDLERNHKRTSLGFEARSAVFEILINRYIGLGDTYNESFVYHSENVLDGWDYKLSSQIPQLHWADIFLRGYEWEGITRDDIKGLQYGSDMLLTSHMSLEFAYDDKKKDGIKDEWYAKLLMFYPPKEGPTAKDGIADNIWRENRNMSGELLSKVDRQNKIFIEYEGSSTISRTD